MKKRKNLVQKFRKFYFALPKDEQVALWDILAAIRGEDGGSFTLKIFTTARVRGALFGKSQTDFANRGLVFASLKKAQSYNKRGYEAGEANLMGLWNEADGHFRAHIETAIRALVKHGFKRATSDLRRFISFNGFKGVVDDYGDGK